ncbi:thioesterase family protein [Euzebya sp.]|uniref:thioesterase family protein n=1 Tax=Euzebya sp. TaxID=1971409 RepID=UPI003515134D
MEDTEQIPLGEALAVRADGDVWTATVHDGFDVHGIPHGGYLAALAGSAVLAATGQPDLFTTTTHYLRKAAMGPIAFAVSRVGGSRRFTTVTATGTQQGEPVLAVMASVGDRTTIEGPSWHAAAPWDPDSATLSPRADADEVAFPAPRVSRRVGMRLDTATTGFTEGRTGEVAEIRVVTDLESTDARLGQLAALIACDITPPAVWAAMGVTGWVPTVELTAHVRARPAAGPLTVRATTNHVGDGFLDEDALVHDGEGRLVVQSRQLARFSASSR